MKARPRRRTFGLIWQHGKLWKYPIRWTDAGLPISSPPTTLATLGDIMLEAERLGDTTTELLDRLRGTDRQWQLDHA